VVEVESSQQAFFRRYVVRIGRDVCPGQISWGYIRPRRYISGIMWV